VERLGLALGAYDDDTAERLLTNLAMGTWEERRELAKALAGDRASTLVATLAPLAGDEIVQVRAAAGSSAARRLSTGRGGNIEREVVARLTRSDGALCAFAMLSGINPKAGVDPELVNVVMRLSDHPSARVRQGANTMKAAIEEAGRPKTAS
jgi:hypothetical protein